MHGNCHHLDFKALADLFVRQTLHYQAQDFPLAVALQCAT
jgi:hypothetical protein